MKSISFFKHPLGKTLRSIVIAYLLLTLLVFAFQKQLLYHPESIPRETEIETAAQFHGSEFFDSTGEFCGWMIAPPHSNSNPDHLPTKTVVIFHGNIRSASARDYLARPFYSNPLTSTWTILLFEYPGFGHRPGNPDEKSIIEKALRAIDTLQGPLVIVGESLGTGVAARVVAERSSRVEGLLLLTPFNNMTTIATVHYPYLPIPLILTEHYPSDQNLSHYSGKAAFILAGDDEVTPIWTGLQLFEEIPGPKKKWIVPGAKHEGISHDPQTVWWRESVAFLAEP